MRRRPSTPGEIVVEEFLKPLSVTVSAFARHIGVVEHDLADVLDGRVRVTPELAVRFSCALGPSPELWLNPQHSVDVYDAHHGARTPRIDRIRGRRARSADTQAEEHAG